MWTSMIWVSDSNQKQIKCHIVQPGLEQTVLRDLEIRHGLLDPPQTEKVKRAYYDLGGALFIDEPWLRLYLAPGAFDVMASQAEHLMGRLERKLSEPPRNGRWPWIKLHGRYFCICLSMRQAERLYRLLKGRVQLIGEADRKALRMHAQLAGAPNILCKLPPDLQMMADVTEGV